MEENMNIKYKSDEPYPSIENVVPNQRYAMILASSYSGQVSEVTAVMQYIYHKMVMPEDLKWVARELRQIAIVEMHHLDMLGDCILKLGMNPKYMHFDYKKPEYWNASNVYYGKTPKEMVEANLRDEYKAIEQYNKTIRMIEDNEVQNLIKRIIKDEEIHIERLKEILTKIQ